MHNKTTFLSIASTAVFMASALFFGNACAMASLSIPQGQHEKSPAETAQSTTVASDNQQSVSYNWDRSGVDRASVHLQILMQSSALFNENTAVANTQKKSNIAAKKNPPKAASST